MPREHTTQNPEYRRNRDLLLREHPQCSLCTNPADTVDHIRPVSQGGGHSLDNLRPMCRSCNSKLGQRTKAQNQQARDAVRAEYLRDLGIPLPRTTPNPNKRKETQQNFLGERGLPPTLCISPRGEPNQPELAPMGHDRPRLETARPEQLESLTPAIREWAHRYLGKELMPWQCHVLDGMTAVRDDGKFWHRLNLLSTARQNGKSVLLGALAGYLCTWEPVRRGQPLTILSTAHRLDLATELFLQLAPILTTHFGGKATNQYGRCEWRGEDGTRWLVRAAGPSVGHGLSLDAVLIDEIWDVSAEAVDQGLLPAMRARPNPLCVMVSTAGTEASQVLLRFREQGLRQIDQGKVGGFYMAEFSPPPELDPMSEAAWAYANPSLGHLLDIETLRAEAQSPDRAAMLRASVNVWITTDRGWVQPGRWPELLYDGPVPAGGIVAVETSLDGSRYFGVRAVPLPDGRCVVTVAFHVDTMAQCLAELERLAKDARIRFLLTPTVDLQVPRHLEPRRSVVGYAELLKYTAAVRNMIQEGTLAHTGETMLAEHVQRAVAVRAQGQLALSSQRSPGPIELARCMVWAAAIAARPAASGKPLVIMGGR